MYLGKGIVTTGSWIYVNDGNCYQAFFGECNVKDAKDLIGCRTGSGQADFVIQIGKKCQDYIILSGCEFKSFQKCKSVPKMATPKIFIVK